MIVKNLELHNFRNHENKELQFSDHINLILGPNGIGKTNIIDAIHVLCMSKSFVTRSDSLLIKKGSSSFHVHAEISSTFRSKFNLSYTYGRGDGKKFKINDSPISKLADLIGLVPIVVLSPQDRSLTSEGPDERRSFLDSMVSQLSKSYFQDLIQYRKVIKQRNKILSDEFQSIENKQLFLEPWDFQFIELGSKIIHKRLQILTVFEAFLQLAYEKISSVKLTPSFTYKCSLKEDIIYKSLSEIKSIYEQSVIDAKEKEMERGFTGIGPHRDDLIFFLDEMEVRKYGSQGQHKLFALSLKLAELLYLDDQLDDKPIFLLDDVFGDLDPQKISVFVEMLQSHEGQTFITAANPALFSHINWMNESSNKQFNLS